jgi:methylmalonyl-CoA/ethylmalonyl-CoA epimerase
MIARRAKNGDRAMASIAQAWVPQGNFHHFGFVVSSIPATVKSFMESMSLDWDGHTIHDPNQGVRVTFLSSKNAADPLVELVEPVGADSPVSSFLKRGGGLHHVCYVVDSLDEQLKECHTKRALVVRPPLPAAAFGGRRIAWAYTRNKLLIEYLER